MPRVFWSMPQEYIDAVHEMAKAKNLHPSRIVSGLIRDAMPKRAQKAMPVHAGPGRKPKPKDPAK